MPNFSAISRVRGVLSGAVVAAYLALSGPLANASSELPVALEAVGARAAIGSRLLDTNAQGNQLLTSTWRNDGLLSTAWFTLDMLSSQVVSDVRLAPRADVAVTLSLLLGDQLSSGQVVNGAVFDCTLPGGAATVPTSLASCSIPPTSGRYLTVRSVNRAQFRMYGVQIIGESSGGGNQAPEADFFASSDLNPLQIHFDAGTSSDPDGQILSWQWQFGDGAGGVGETVSHRYERAGTYTVSLTVTDDDGASAEQTQSLVVQSDSDDNRLPLAILATGARSELAELILDTHNDGAQDLGTSWRSRAAANTRWITVDLGASQTVTDVRIAPRRDISASLQIVLSDELLDERASGGTSVSCDLPGGLAAFPSSLSTCPLNATGRYLTISKTNTGQFRIHGLEVLGVVGNQPPVIMQIDEQLVSEGTPFSLTVSAQDADGPPPILWDVSHDLPGAPALLSDLGGGVARLEWTDTSSQEGSYSITVFASDADDATTSETFVLRVVANQAPEIAAIEDQEVLAGTTLVVPVFVEDRDGPLPLLVSQHNTIPQQPELLMLMPGDPDGDPQTVEGSIQWTPSLAHLGAHPIEIRAQDGEGNESTRSFVITVVEDVPLAVLEVSTATVPGGSLVDLSALGSADWMHWGGTVDQKIGSDFLSNALPLGTVAPKAFNATSANYAWQDGEPTTQATAVRSGLRNGTNEHGFRLEIPASDKLQTLRLFLGVRDAAGRVDVQLGDDSDALQAPLLIEGSSKSTREVVIEFQGNTPSSVLSVEYTKDPSGGNGGWISLEAAALESAPNTAPVFGALEPQVALLGVPWQVEVTVQDDSVVPPVLSQSNDLPGTPDLFLQNNGFSAVLGFTPSTSLAAGSQYSVLLTATDEDNASTTLAIPLELRQNEAPVLAPIVDQTLVEGASLSLSVNASDPDGPLPLTLVLAETPGGDARLVDAGFGSGQFIWTTEQGTARAAPYPVTVAASDAAGLSTQTSFLVTVLENSVPVVSDLEDIDLLEGQVQVVAVSATDPDGHQPITLDVLTDAPAGSVTLVDLGGGQGTIQFAPTPGDAGGPYVVSIVARDSLGAQGVRTLSFSVVENVAPVLLPFGDQIVRVGDTLTLPVIAVDAGGPPNLTLALTGSIPNADLSFTDHGMGSGTLTLAPASESAGSAYALTLRATDGLGAFSEVAFWVSVEPRTAPFSAVVRAPTDLDLTREGSLDWLLFGYNGAATVAQRKKTTDGPLGSPVFLDAPLPTTINKPVAAWLDGEVVPSGSTNDAIRFTNVGGGIELEIQAPPLRRRLTLYLAVHNASARVTTAGAAVSSAVIDSEEGQRGARVIVDFEGTESVQSLTLRAELTAEYAANARLSVQSVTLDESVDLAAESGLQTRPANSSCMAWERPSPTLALSPLFQGESFVDPVMALQAPNESVRWYVAQRDGQIKRLENAASAASEASIYLDLTQAVLPGAAEGLLSFAFHPAFADQPYLFVSYLRQGLDGPELTLSRFTQAASGMAIEPGSELEVLTQRVTSSGNLGGALVFGPDGYLYWALGDNGAAGNDPADNSQNRATLLGSVVRIDVDTATPYSVPSSNPFVGEAGRAEIFAYGFRHPSGMSFDPVSGELFLSDVGQSDWEEVNRVLPGANYGWRCYEAYRANTHVSPQNCPAAAEVEFPVTHYGHEEGRFALGGVRYRGTRHESLAGVFVFGDAVSGEIFGLFEQAGLPDRRRLFSPGFALAAIAESADRELVIIAQDGSLHEVTVGSPPAGGVSAPQTLSDSGCVNVAEVTQPPSGVVPYDVVTPHWNDSAEALHQLALPDSEQVHVRTDRRLLLPAGSVVLQHLSLADQLVETRMLVRHADGGWAGYSYEWAADGSDATLVGAEGKEVQIQGQSWRFPSAESCLQCHNDAAGYGLGLQVKRLNRAVDYSAVTSATTSSLPASQLRTWEHIGLLDQPLFDVEHQRTMPSPLDGEAGLTERARSYLDANCASCHRPANTTDSGLDLRFDVPFAQTNLCDVVPEHGDYEVANARLLAPGNPAASILSLRMASVDAHPDAFLNASTPDVDGTALINRWIQSVQSCPLPPPGLPLVEADSATQNIEFDVPARVAQLGAEHSEMWRSGFIDLSWWDGYDGYVIDPTGQQDSVDGINEVIRVAHDYDVAVYAPPGQYLVSREISLMREDHPGRNCRGSSRKTNVFIGDQTNPPTFVLDDNPSVDFNDPGSPRPVFHLWTLDGPGEEGGVDCDLEEHDQSEGNYDVNGVDFQTKEANGFRQLLRNVKIDVGGGAKAGATCFKAKAAQGSYLEDIDCELRNGFAGSQSLPGRLGAVVDLEVRGGKHCLWLNEAGTADFAVNVKCTGQSGVVFGANGRAPTTLIGFEIEHDVSLSPVFQSVDGVHFRSGAGSITFVDGKVTLTGNSAGSSNPVWNNLLGRNWHISNVYVEGGAAGQSLIRSGDEVIATPAPGWHRITEYQYTARDSQAAAQPDGNGVKYTSNASFRMLDGGELSKETLVTLSPEVPPASIRTQHELANSPFFLDDGVVNTLTDLGITNRGDRDVTAELQQAIDSFDRVYMPRGVYFLSAPGLVLGEDTTLFGHNVSHTRLLWSPTYQASEVDEQSLISTVDSATATTRFEGVSLFRYGADGQESNYAQTLVHWRAGAKSIWGWGQGDLYAAGSNPLLGHAGKQYRYTGNGGGRRIMFFDIEDDKTIHPDHHRLVIEDTTGQPLTLYTFSPEHEEGPHPFLQIRNASNIRIYGNKSECSRRFAEIDASDNVGLFGQGVGCISLNPFTNYDGPNVDGLPIITIKGNSTNVVVANSVPTRWHPSALSLLEQFNSEMNSYPTGSMVSLFKRGDADFSGSVFNHQP